MVGEVFMQWQPEISIKVPESEARFTGWAGCIMHHLHPLHPLLGAAEERGSSDALNPTSNDTTISANIATGRGGSLVCRAVDFVLQSCLSQNVSDRGFAGSRATVAGRRAMIGRACHALQIVCPELGILAAVPLYLYYLYY